MSASSEPNRTESILEAILRGVLGQGALPERMDAATPLLSEVPELDSMAVLGILTQIEAEFGIQIDDDDINAEVFRNFGTLWAFVEGHRDRPPEVGRATPAG